MMSAPFSPAARTRTRISPAPGTGSGCSSITSSPSRIVTARTGEAYPGLPETGAQRGGDWRHQSRLPPLQHGDALDVMGLGKHVDGLDRAQAPAGLGEFGRV